MAIDTASERFNRIATSYANSEVHSMSPTIKRLHALLNNNSAKSVCDVACGAGHLALSFADRVSRIVGVDPAPNMLETFRGLAQQRGIEVETIQSRAETIPLPSNEFDLVMSRLAPHHFTDIQKAVYEMRRLTKPEGFVVVIDLEGDADPAIDEFNHRIELLHDPTHVRSYTAARWQELFGRAGLIIEAFEPGLTERPGGVPLHRWCEIAASGDEAEAEIRNLLEQAPAKTLAVLGITYSEGEYRVPVRTLLVVGRKPSKQ